MRLNPSQLAGHLARGLAPVYLIAGEEPLLIQESLDALRAAARRQGYSEREVLDVERGFEWQRLREACNSLSLFAQKRIVELQMPGGAPGVEGGEVLRGLAQSPPPDTLFVVVCGKLESRTRSSAWYTALENAGASVYAWPVKPEELPAWIGGRFKAAGLNASPDAIRLLAERTEGNLLAAAQDIAKLKLLFPGVPIGAEEVQTAVADSARFGVFDLCDKMLEGDAAGAARSLARLREEGDVELPELLGALTYNLRQWAQAAAVYAQSRDAERACEAAGVFRQRQPRFIKALQRTRPAQVLGWLRRCADIDGSFKSGAQAQAWEDLLTCLLTASGAAGLK